MPNLRLLTVLPVLLMAAISPPQSALSQAGGFGSDLSASDVDPNYKPTLTFDVATIRPVQRSGRLSVGVDSPPHASHFQATNLTLRILIQIAYGFGSVQVVGGPEWLDTDYYNVEAKSDHSVDERLAKLPDGEARLEKIHMLQTLLADRLQLKTHWETREGRVFDLVIAKGGLKLKPTPVTPAQPGQPAPIAGALGPLVNASGNRHGIEFQCRRVNMHGMTALLTSQIHTPVVDKTGLTGAYDFTLQFGRENSTDPEAFPSIFTALQEQLGLRLDSSKGPIQTLVIDQIEPPSEN